MPRAFNFYQDTGFGTGLYNPTNYVDFFTGFYFPPALEIGATAGFFWPMSDREIALNITTSGDVTDSNKHIISLGVGFYAFISPLITDSGRMYSSFSGNIPSGSRDNVTFSARFSSYLTGDNIDRPNLRFNLGSGNIFSGEKDFFSFSVITSGSAVNDNKDYCQYHVSFRGQFTGPDSDESAVMMRMSDISYSDTASYTSDGSTDNVGNQFRVITILYSNAS